MKESYTFAEQILKEPKAHVSSRRYYSERKVYAKTNIF